MDRYCIDLQNEQIFVGKFLFCQKSLKTNTKWSFYNVNFSVAAGFRGSKLWPLESLLILLSSYTPYRGVRNLRFSCYLRLNEKIPNLLYEKFRFFKFLAFSGPFLVQTAIIWLLDAPFQSYLKFIILVSKKSHIIAVCTKKVTKSVKKLKN